jgi:hypothetical protein
MEWVVLDPCDQALNPSEVEQELYINHCLWWAWSAIMWMGCEVAPKVEGGPGLPLCGWAVR